MSAHEGPVDQLVFFSAQDSFVKDPAAFEEIRNIAQKAESAGLIEQWWGQDTKNASRYVWFLRWKSHAQSLTASTSLQFLTKINEIAKDVVHNYHIVCRTGVLYSPMEAVLKAPVNSVAIAWRSVSMSKEYNDHMDALFDALEGTDGYFGTFGGASLEDPGFTYYGTGWDKIDTHMYNGENNKAFKAAGDLVLDDSVTNLHLFWVVFKRHPQ